MAKGIANRQKLTIRIEPSQRALKPRNPIALPANQRVAGAHQKSTSTQRQLEKHLVKKVLGESEKD